MQHGGDLGAAAAPLPGRARNLSSTFRPGSIPIPIRCRAFLPTCSRACRMPTRSARSASWPRAPMAHRPPLHVVPAPGTQILLPLVAALVRGGRAAVLAAELSRARARRGARRTPRNSGARDRRLRRRRRWSSSATPTIPTAGCLPRPLCSRLPTSSAPARRRARGRRGLHGCRAARREPRRRGGVRQRRRAALVRQIFWPCRACGSVSRWPRRRWRRGLAAMLGPWAVSGPALAVGSQGAGGCGLDRAHAAPAGASGNKLDAILTGAGLDIVGGTSLFRLAQLPAANALFRSSRTRRHPGARFPGQSDWLRFGLPANEQAWRRLQAALASFPARGSRHCRGRSRGRDREVAGGSNDTIGIR